MPRQPQNQRAAVPLQPYRARQYRDEEKENTAIATSSAASRRRQAAAGAEEDDKQPNFDDEYAQQQYRYDDDLPYVQSEQLPQSSYASAYRPPQSSISSPSKPPPFSYLPATSPIKRAWLESTRGTSQELDEGGKSTQRGGRRLTARGGGSLFADFLANSGNNNNLKDDGPLSSRSNASTSMGDILSELRAAKKSSNTSSSSNLLLIKEEEEKKAALELKKKQEAEDAKRRSARQSSRSRSRSGSRSRSRSRHTFSSPPHRHHALPDSKIDFALIQSYLRPLGLTLDSLHHLSSASIAALAEAVATKSVKPTLPKEEEVTIRGRPRSKQSKEIALQEAERTNTKSHYVSHSKVTEEETQAFALTHPSLVQLRSKRITPSSGGTVASGGRGLPLDPAVIQATKEANRRIAELRAKEREKSLRPQEEAVLMEEEKKQIYRNRSLEEIVPPQKVEQLLRFIDDQPVFTSKPKARSPSPAKRGHDALEMVHSHKHAQISNEEYRQIPKQRAQVLSDIIRRENKERALAAKISALSKRKSDSTTTTTKSIPHPLTTRQLAAYLESGTTPEGEFSIDGIYCRVVVRLTEEWKWIEGEVERHQYHAAGVPPLQIPTRLASPSPTAPVSHFPLLNLSSSQFSFVTSSDFILYIMHTPRREADWLHALGFEKEWARRKVAAGAHFKIVLFRARREGSSEGPIKASIQPPPSEEAKEEMKYPLPSADKQIEIKAHHATWQSVFDFMLPELLKPLSSDPSSVKEAKQTLLKQLLSMDDEIIRTPWKDVSAQAHKRGLEHVYEGRPKLSLEEAAKLVHDGKFDLVEARRFLNHHLHLTSLYHGDGLTQPESHSEHEDVHVSGRAHRFREYVVLTQSMLELPEVQFIDLLHPLGRASATPVTSSSLPDWAMQRLLTTHHRSRSRSRERTRTAITSAIDSGLKLKPGTPAYEAYHAAKLAKEKEKELKQMEEQKALRDSKRAEVVRKEKERKKEIKLKKKLEKEKELFVPPALPILSPSPLPTALPPQPTEQPKSLDDEYATDEFDHPSSSSHVVTESNLPSTVAPSSAMAAALSVLGAHPAATSSTSSKKKSKRRSSKKKRKQPKMEEKKYHLPLKPQLPDFKVKSPKKTKQSSAASATSDLTSTTTIPATAPSSTLTPAELYSSERKRKAGLLTAQLDARKAEHLSEIKKSRREMRQKKERLKALHKKCRELAKSSSGANVRASSASASLHTSPLRSSSLTRRTPSASPLRRLHALEDSQTADMEHIVDQLVAVAIVQDDAHEIELAKRREAERMEEQRKAHEKAMEMQETLRAMGRLTPSSSRRRSAPGTPMSARILSPRMGASPRVSSSSPARVPSSPRAKSPRILSSAALHARLADAATTPTTGSQHLTLPSVQEQVEPILHEPATQPPQQLHSPRQRHSQLASPQHRSQPQPQSQLSPQSQSQPQLQLQQQTVRSPPPAKAVLSPAITTAAIPTIPIPDPRAENVCTLAQQLSTRFSSLLEKVNEKQSAQAQREMVVNAAALSSNVTRHEPSEEAKAVTERVHELITPPTHLQQPYERVVAASSLQPTVNSVLLPAPLMHSPMPSSRVTQHSGPLPHENVSNHAILFAEHIPNASTFVSHLPPPSADPAAPFVFTFPSPAASQISARPYYDLATREYRALQERIQHEKERLRFL